MALCKIEWVSGESLVPEIFNTDAISSFVLPSAPLYVIASARAMLTGETKILLLDWNISLKNELPKLLYDLEHQGTSSNEKLIILLTLFVSANVDERNNESNKTGIKKIFLKYIFPLELKF